MNAAHTMDITIPVMRAMYDINVRGSKYKPPVTDSESWKKAVEAFFARPCIQEHQAKYPDIGRIELYGHKVAFKTPSSTPMVKN